MDLREDERFGQAAEIHGQLGQVSVADVADMLPATTTLGPDPYLTYMIERNGDGFLAGFEPDERNTAVQVYVDATNLLVRTSRSCKQHNS